MNIRRIPHSIVVRLFVLGLGIVMCGAAVRYVALTRFLREDLGTVVAAQQLALATYVARDVDYKVSQRRLLLERLAAALPVDLLGEPARLDAWLAERHELQPLFSEGLFVVDPRGNMLADFPERQEQGSIDLAGRDYIRAALAGSFYIGRPVPGPIAGVPVLPMAAPVKNARGEVQAVLVGVTELAAPGFLDLLQHSRIGETGGFLLISPRDHLFVAATQPELILRPTPPAGSNVLHDRAMAGFRGSGVTVNTQGVEDVSAMVSVPSAGWFVVARLPTAEAFVTVDRTQRYLVRNAMLGVLGFLVLLAVGLYFVFRPLLRAAEHADRMTLGEAPLAPLPVVRNDEVGHLTSAFNRLLRKLTDTQTELARIAHHDALTGLPNRVLLADRLSLALAQARRKGMRLALLFLDLDGFKPINDSLGHDAGDEALRQVAQRLGRIVREADTLARIGGDEFVLLICDLDDSAEAAACTVAAKCISAMAAPFALRGENRVLGVSIGVVLSEGEDTPEALLLAADQAMYQAKDAGRDCYVLGRQSCRPGLSGVASTPLVVSPGDARSLEGMT
jgi:diguanylate cyclase